MVQHGKSLPVVGGDFVIDKKFVVEILNVAFVIGWI